MSNLTTALHARTPKAARQLGEYEAVLSAYRDPSAFRAVWQLATTLLVYGGLWALAYFSLWISYWATGALVLVAALFLVRIFVLQHDCGHRSLFKSKRANDTVGFFLGILTLTPYQCWRRSHAVHHANSGDLDRRGRTGEIYVMTVNEYRNASWWQRLAYRIYRNPIALFCIGPFFYFAIRQRFAFDLPKAWKKERRSVYWTNLGLLVASAFLCWLIGPWHFLIIHALISAVSATIGVWLFYVQHQYERAYWKEGDEWNYVEAAITGSSHYRLPKILRWLTASIGVHHIHHLDSRIPNYRLQTCHDENPELRCVNEVSLLQSFSCIFLKLWDEEQGKMVGFSAAA